MKQKTTTLFRELSSIFGLGRRTVITYYYLVGLNPRIRPQKIKKVQKKIILKNLLNHRIGQRLRRYIQGQLKFYYEIKS